MSDPRTASVQYDDFRGQSAADISDTKSLKKLAQELGIEGPYSPIGLSFFSGAPRGPGAEQEEVYVTLYAIDTTKVDPSVEPLNEHIRQQGGTLLVTAFDATMKLTDLLDYFKRLKVTLFRRYIEADSMEVAESMHVDDEEE